MVKKSKSGNVVIGGKNFSPRSFVVSGFIVILLTFGVLGGWAATAPLASAVIAPGVVSVESNRKKIQHFEGGIVDRISVQVGDLVTTGQELVVFESTQAQANVTVLTSREDLLMATLARLEAAQKGAAEINFPAYLLEDSTPQRQAMIATQEDVFRDGRASRDGRVSINEARIGQIKEEIAGTEIELVATNEQKLSVGAELERLRDGETRGVVRLNVLTENERYFSELRGNVGRLTAQIARLKQSIVETELQILLIKQEYKENAANEVKEVRDQLNETATRRIVAEDILARVVVRAPLDGIVQNLKVHTIGGVIRPAETIMEIVPSDDELIINANVRPLDIDSIDQGDVAEVRFSAFSSRTIPLIQGKIEVLSADTIQPENPNVEPYYLARVRVAQEDVPDEIRGRLLPGMPAEVIIVTGERTLVDYLMKPLKDSISKSLREE